MSSTIHFSLTVKKLLQFFLHLFLTKQVQTSGVTTEKKVAKILRDSNRRGPPDQERFPTTDIHYITYSNGGTSYDKFATGLQEYS